MRRLLSILLLLAAGAGVGSGAAFVTGLLLGPAPAAASAPAVEPGKAFVPTGPVLAPLVLPDGRLAGYYRFEVQLEVDEDQAEQVAARLPLLLHAINLKTFRTPLASGPDGMLPNIGLFRNVVMAAAPEAFGPGIVHRAAITQANPE